MFTQAMLIFVVKIISNYFNFWLILNSWLVILRKNNPGSLEEERLVNCFSEQDQRKTEVKSMFKMYTEIYTQWNIIQPEKGMKF